MKYTLENFFEELNPNELDEIMPNNFDEKMPKKALSRIEKTALQKSGIENNRRHFNFKIFAPVAACLVLTAGIGGFAIAAEAREYNAAVDFFAQNGLSAEGLSREDLKAVYRDISTNRFMNDKTVEVIKRSVPGVEILQEEPTPDELAVLWNSNINMWNGLSAKNSVKYQWDYEYKDAEMRNLEKIIVECLRGGETLWKTEFPSPCEKWNDSFYIDNCVMMSADTAVWGNRAYWTERDLYEHFTYSWLARVDDSGNKLWQIELDHGFDYECIRAVLDNGDGTWAVISEGDFEYLCLSQFDINGNELSFQKTKVGRMSILNAARLGDGYLVQTSRAYSAGGGRANIVKLDHNGNVTDNFVYESDDCDYYITDMTEFEGNVYLSAYAVPKSNDWCKDGLFEILDNIISEKGELDVSPEDLTPAVREHYTAVLLLCDSNGGKPKTFYSAKSSLGGALAVENNQLKWNVENIILAGYIPYINSFPISGKSLVYRYSFDENGALVGCEDTGKVVGFLR
ncbi:MAG: hypothetical protein K2N06_00590 [Oscillospiraceae bacterium]|nr:hypothetical protein [Oscillospiraceae bacterium]